MSSSRASSAMAARRIRDVDGGDGREDTRLVADARQRAHDQLAPGRLVGAAILGQIDLRQQYVVVARACEQLERARVDDALVVDRPAVERVLGSQEVRELRGERRRELRRERLERHPGCLAVIGEESALTAGLRDGRDAQPARSAPPSEHLEGLEEVVEVVHLDGAVTAKQGGEGAVRADERARVRQRCPRGSRRAPDLEADDRDAGRGAARERLGKGRRPSHRLEEDAHRASSLVLGEEADDVGGVSDELPAAGDDDTEADPRPAGDERLRDRARLRHHRHVTRQERRWDRAEPGRGAVRPRDTHAVVADGRGAELVGAGGQPPCDARGFGPRLGADARDHEGADAGRGCVLERLLDAAVADEQQRRLRQLRQRGDRRRAAQAERVGSRGVNAPRHAAGSKHVRDRRGLRRRGAHDREGARVEERREPAAQLIPDGGARHSGTITDGAPATPSPAPELHRRRRRSARRPGARRQCRAPAR